MMSFLKRSSGEEATAAAGSGANQGPAKVRAVAGEAVLATVATNNYNLSKDDMKALIGGAQEALRNSRTALGIVLVTFKLPSQLSAAKMSLEAGTEYQKKTKGIKGHGMGAPSNMTWSGLVVGAVEDAKSEPAASDPDATSAAANLAVHIAAITSPNQLSQVVEHCHARQAHTDVGDYVIISIAVKPSAAVLLQNITSVLRSHNVLPEEGAAPPGPNERRLRKMQARFQGKQ